MEVTRAEHGYVARSTKATVKCLVISDDFYIDDYLPKEKSMLNIGSVHDLDVKNCRTRSSYTTLLEAMGITFMKRSSLKLFTNSGGKDVNITLTRKSFSSPNALYSNLEDFRIEGEGVRAIDGDTFQTFQDLKYFTIYKTSVSELPENLLAEMPLLHTVSIFHNEHLHGLPLGMFAKNTLIQKLDITHNQIIKQLHPSLLKPLKNLTELNIGSNNLVVIPQDLLKHNCDSLTKLTILEDFYDCPSGCVRKLTSEFLKTCGQLRQFLYSLNFQQFKNNSLDVPSSFFKYQNQSSLRTVELKHANLPLARILTLFFDDNQLKDVFENLSDLDLTGNAIPCKEMCTNRRDCDCDVMRRLSQLKNFTNNFRQITCVNESTKLQQLNVEKVSNIFALYCERTNFETIIISVIGISTLLFCILVIYCAKEHILICLYNHPLFSKLFTVIRFVNTTCVCQLHPNHTDCKLECTCRDAFISYANQDEEFANLLVDTLEDNSSNGNNTGQKQMAGRSFTCLVHQRDWMAGKPIAVNIRYV